MKRAVVAAAMPWLLAASLSEAADLEGRVTRIENILENQRGSDLLLQMQRLQADVQLLRGTVEQLQFDLQALQRQQRDQYLDLDARLRDRAPGAAAPPPAPARGAAPDPAGNGRPSDALLTPRQPAAAGGTGQQGAPAPGRPAGEREAYRDAFDLLKQRRYEEAIAAFDNLLARYPDGELSDNARYWLGEAHYVKRDYAAALDEFRRVVDDHPGSPKAAGSMLKIGYIQDEQEDWQRARETLEGLTRKFPDSTESRLARSRLERMSREGH
jgi:tol-pal system protein YbgF